MYFITPQYISGELREISCSTTEDISGGSHNETRHCITELLTAYSIPCVVMKMAYNSLVTMKYAEVNAMILTDVDSAVI